MMDSANSTKQDRAAGAGEAFSATVDIAVNDEGCHVTVHLRVHDEADDNDAKTGALPV